MRLNIFIKKCSMQYIYVNVFAMRVVKTFQRQKIKLLKLFKNY